MLSYLKGNLPLSVRIPLITVEPSAKHGKYSDCQLCQPLHYTPAQRAHVTFDSGFAHSLVHLVTWSTPGAGLAPGSAVTLGDLGAGVGQLGGWLRDNKVSNISWRGWDGGNNIESFVGQKVRQAGASDRCGAGGYWWSGRFRGAAAVLGRRQL